MTPDELRESDQTSRIREAEIERRYEARKALLDAIGDYIDQEIAHKTHELVSWAVVAEVERRMKGEAGPALRQIVANAIIDNTNVRLELKP